MMSVVLRVLDIHLEEDLIRLLMKAYLLLLDVRDDWRLVQG